MLTIRQEQWEALRLGRVEDFKCRMRQHLHEFFTLQCQALGEAGIGNLIDVGTSRASTYGIEIERDVCVFIDLMIELGQDFDSDAHLPWVEEILNDPDMPDPSGRIRRLYDESRRYLADREQIGAAFSSEFG